MLRLTSSCNCLKSGVIKKSDDTCGLFGRPKHARAGTRAGASGAPPTALLMRRESEAAGGRGDLYHVRPDRSRAELSSSVRFPASLCLVAAFSASWRWCVMMACWRTSTLRLSELTSVWSA
eukprot:scaffold34009_cov55-Phaeocystis_antarctica.AAC.4